MGQIYPAHAGINLMIATIATTAMNLPRTRGDKPIAQECAALHLKSTPHTRG